MSLIVKNSNIGAQYDTFFSKLSLEFCIYFDYLWSYFRGFRFYLHKMFRFVFLVQPDNTGCQKYQIKSNNNLKCVISVLNIIILKYQIHIQKKILDFVLYVKVCTL